MDLAEQVVEDASSVTDADLARSRDVGLDPPLRDALAVGRPIADS
jgi:hypothetical protein